MKRILGLDLGTNSIGWAIVDKENQEIIDSGVRIFPEGVVAKTIGTGDKEQSNNATRREKRQSRRQYYRRRLRKIQLLRLLIQQEMCPLSENDINTWKNKKEWKDNEVFPQTKEFKQWIALNPYELRDKALSGDLTLMELGRILYHFIQRRGFLSGRKNNEDGKIFEGKEDIVGIDDTKEQIKGTTLGAYLNSILPSENESYKRIKNDNDTDIKARGRYTLRDMYVAEFEQIWQKQACKLKLDLIKVAKTKVRYLKGNLDNNRNDRRLQALKNRYGNENINIETILSYKGAVHKITSTEYVSLKKALAGDISIVDDIITHKTQDSVLFWQRPLRSQKSLLAKCTFEPRKTPVPISHPDYEVFRAYQFVNNIEYGTHQRLSPEQRETVIEFIRSKKMAFKFAEIPKKLNLTYEKFNFDDTYSVSGCPTIAQLSKLFPDEVWESSYIDIWHSFLFFDDSEKLLEHLKNKNYNLNKADYTKVTGSFNPKTQKRTSGIVFKEEYANISLKAIRNILPFLRKGYRFSDATILGGVRNAFGVVELDNNKFESRYDNYFAHSHEQIENDILKLAKDKNNKEGDAIRKIKQYLTDPNNNFSPESIKPNKLYHHSQPIKKAKLNDNIKDIENLRNPIVQQGVNETARLVNSLLKKYDKFDQIKVELGRDLKNGKKRRQDLSKRIKENFNQNEKAREALNEYGLAHTRNNIQRYLLWCELQNKNGVARCPYTGKTINIKDALGNENKVQIEHIIPKSVSLDDSFANKTLCDSLFNREKGELTPKQFYDKNDDSKMWGVESWDEVEHRAFSLLPYAKAKRFTASRKDLNTNDFIQRQLNDTRYISKKITEILSQVCSDVRVLPGALTSELRKLWGLNNILDPIENIDQHLLTTDITKKNNLYYLVTNKQNEVVSLHQKYNTKPELQANQTSISGCIKKGTFTSRNIDYKINNIDLPDGEYWTVLDLSEQVFLTQKFIEKPSVSNNQIVLRGKVNKNKFTNDSLGKNTPAQLDNGIYWAKFNIKNIKFEKPEKGKHPKNKNGIVLFGNVDNGIFTSYIYTCQSNEPDGKYWIIIDLDLENVLYSSAINTKPNIQKQQVIVEGTVNEQGLFISETDPQHTLNTQMPKGKYWAVFDVRNEVNQFTALKQDMPEIEKEQNLREGNIWIDKNGEIKFDPKKNRDDHRHHAIDAIAIALTEQSYLQKLSMYNQVKENRKRGVEDNKPEFDLPWSNFYEQVKNVASNILISYKQNSGSIKSISKRINKDGKIIQAKGKAVCGQLHKENVFGKRQSPNETECSFHRRKSISELTTQKHFDKIVDPIVRKIIIDAKQHEVEKQKQIDDLKKQLKKANEIQELSINKQILDIETEIKLLYTLPNKKGEPVPIKKVRIREKIGNAQLLKSRLGINQYVNPKKNHHAIVYLDENNELNEQVVSLWEVVERKKQGQDVYQLPVPDKNRPIPKKIVATLQINDMFLLGLSDNEYQSNINNNAFLSSYLYKVQKLSGGDYFFELCFRHHLDSRPDGEAKIDYRYIKNFGTGVTGWQTMNPIKIKINNLGKIIKL
ncbi:MAG: type II CRISPR RNA-guided endonuclease Cas9 [Bacteroidales bacterium]|nr:type II CRISPR RNA-guided endonuclease Cas9 [Bacteroidales bacterium]